MDTDLGPHAEAELSAGVAEQREPFTVAESKLLLVEASREWRTVILLGF
jgi:hypothetical protein